jgi:DNA-binding winged helix-turn-helix (wHTH) protein/TolB-like protein/Tfp pilus assembly protein PilF
LTYEFGEFQVDSGQRVVINRNTGQPVTLTPRAFDLLVFLLDRPNELIDKPTLIRALWSRTVVEDNNLDQAVSALRQALGERRGEHRYIQTVHRRGYPLTAPVRIIGPDDPVATGLPIVAPPVAAAVDRSRSRQHIATLIIVCAVVAALIIWASARSGDSTRAPAALKHTLAILPFRPVATGDSDLALQFGIAETLIEGLSRQGVSVTPLSSVRAYADPSQDALAAGRALGVQAILEGHLQRSGERVRVSARLLRVSDGTQLWVGRFDENFADILALQDAIGNKVWASLMPHSVGQAAPELRRYTADSGAYHLYVAGRYYREQRLNADGIRLALEYFARAVERDSSFALAWVGMADAYSLLGVFGAMSPNDAFPRAKVAADRALQLAPELGAAHAALAHIKLQFEHDWVGAQRECLQALQYDPTYAGAYQWYAQFLAYSGRFDEAISYLRKAEALEPSVPNYAAIGGLYFVYQRDYSAAIRQLNRALAMDGRQTLARAFLAMAYLEKGDYAQAMAEFEKANGRVPFCTGCRGQIYARTGRAAEARAEAERLIALSKKKYVSPYDIAAVFAALGDRERTFLWLDRALVEHAQHIMWVKWDPVFDPLRHDPRYLALIKKLNLPG